jgi:hypothetical protein
MSALCSLADLERWVAWRSELHGGKRRKVPYSPKGGKAKADDPLTWGTLAAAEARAAKILNGQGGGIGINLGDIGGDTYLAGGDLDTCLSEDGALAPWAEAILAAVPSYAEISPSHRGVKLFFYVASEDVRPFLELTGITNPSQWGFKRSIGHDARDHGPAIELYFAARYFTVTGDRWVTQPDKVTPLDWPSLERLARLIPPARSRAKGADNSRRAIAFRKGAALIRAGYSFEQFVDALHADPETAAWSREKGEPYNMRELRRIWDRAAADQQPLRIIKVLAGLRHHAADQGLEALVAAGTPFYQRDLKLVRVCRTQAKASDGNIVSVPTITPVVFAMLGRALGVAARWEKITGKGETIRIDPPSEVVAQIAGMAGEWPFPPLTGVIGTPTLRPDGSLLITEGYDSITGLVLTDLPQMPSIPDRPTRAAAETALELLKELLTEFPFANEESRSVALSMLLTPVLRGALSPAVPLHVVTAPEAGTGKSYLADIASAIAGGDRCAVLAQAPDQSETEKRLIGAALAGHPIIALDNCSKLLIGDFLCQVTERPVLQLRALGTSAMVRVGNSFTVFANGNNVTVGADVVRRTLQCALDANMENPEERHFRADPLRIVLTDRGRYVAACLTIARAYIVAGKPERQPALPSFEAWSNVVRSALVWLGSADPVRTSSYLRAEDPLRQTRTEVFHAWASELGLSDSGYLSSQIADAAEQRDPYGAWVHPTLREALLMVARARGKGEARIDARRLGLWLHKTTNSIAAGHKLTVDRQDSTRPRWILRPVERCGDAGVAGVASALSREKFWLGWDLS